MVQQMNPEDRINRERVMERLKEAYNVNAFDSYDLFRTRVWKEGETVDRYASTLSRLTQLSGGATPKLLMAAFVSGLPQEACDVICSNARPSQLN